MENKNQKVRVDEELLLKLIWDEENFNSELNKILKENKINKN